MSERFIDRWFGGHVTIGPVTIYGRNAMHFAVNIRSRWGWICFKPPTRCFGIWWPGTPTGATVLWGYRGRNGIR